MKTGVVIKQLECVLSVAMLTVHESFTELEIIGCIHCFTFGEYLIVVAGALSIDC